MIIGSVENPSVLLREVIDNSIDEIYGCSTCNRVYVDTRSTEWNVVADNGRGIPIKLTEEGITMTKLATSRMNAGSKFNKTDEVAVGMNGVGIKATNALSERFVICSKVTEQNARLSIPEVEATYNQLAGAEELFYVLEYAKGIELLESCMTRPDIISTFGFEFPEGMSTITAFIPDAEIFRSIKIELPSRNLRYLNFIASAVYGKQSLDIVLNGSALTDVYTPFRDVFTCKDIVGFDGTSKATFIINFEEDKNLNNREVSGSVNSLPVDRGLHIDLVELAYKEALKDYFKIDHDYLMYGIKLNAIVLAPEVDFSSQTKERLTMLKGFYKGCEEAVKPLKKAFIDAMAKNHELWAEHVVRLEELYKSMVQISTIQKIKNLVNISSENDRRYKAQMPVNVDDATDSDRSKCSLYIVEGQSAGGNMVKARDVRYDAIFYLRGKPLNAVHVDQDTLFENKEMNAILNAIGIGVDEYQVLDNPHFGKIIIATDADPDGLNIASMLIAFFCKRMAALVRAGMLYVVQTPLFIQGDKVAYLGDNVDEIIDKSRPFSRIKGLGELDPSELEEHIFDQNKRRLLQITMENADTAISLMTNTLARKNLMVARGIVADPYNCGV